MNDTFQYNDSLLIDCDFLTHESIVFDIGANEGNWTQLIYDKYKPQMYCFEPAHPFQVLKSKFGDNKDFYLFNYGLGSTNRKFYLFITNKTGGDASEFLETKRHRRNKNGTTAIQLCLSRNFSEFMEEKNITNIDLLALNCEGAEYDIIEYLGQNDLIKSIKCLLIQFHTPKGGVTVPDWENKRDLCRSYLELTHYCEWLSEDNFEKWMKK